MTRADALTSTVSRRVVLKTVGATAITAGLVGCGRGLGSSSSDSNSSTLQMAFWGQGSSTTKTLAALKLFEKKYSVAVDSQYSALSQYYDKLATRIAGGHPPDVFQIHLPYLADYASRGTALKLDPYAKELALSSLPSSISQTSKLLGHYYFMPLGLATQPAVIYSRTTLDRLGLKGPHESWTLDDFRTLTGDVVEASKGQYYGATDNGGGYIELDAYLRGYGKTLFSADGKLNFGQEELTAWLELWQALRTQKSCVPMTMTALNTGMETDAMVTGKAAYTATPTSKGLEVVTGLTKDQLVLAPFPSATKSSLPGTNLIPVQWYAISAKSTNVHHAVQLLKFLTTDLQAASTLGLTRGVPINHAQRKHVSAHLDATDKTIVDNLRVIESKNPPPLLPQPAGADRLLGNSLPNANQAVGYGKKTPAAAAAQFLSDAKQMLK